MKAFSTQTGTFTATQIYNSLMRERTDTMAISRDAYGKFHGMLGDLLQQGLSVLAQIRAGGNEPELKRNFAINVDRAATSLPMVQLSGCGITMPNADTLLQSVKLVWNNKCNEIVSTKATEARVSAAKEFQDQLVAKGWVPDINGQMVAADDPRARTGLKLYVDSLGRETLLAQGASTGVKTAGLSYGLDQVISTTLVASASTEPISSVYESYQLKLDAKGEFDGEQSLYINPTKFGEITFDVTQDSMVNLFTKGIDDRDVSLTLKGGSLPVDGYTSGKYGETGESVSLRLTPGHYTLRVSDLTNYAYMGLPNPAPKGFDASVGVQISKYNSAKIEGKISIKESNEVMPVGMSVAAFDSAGIRVDVDPVTTAPLTLNPSKPVWVVVHGMNSHEDTGAMTSIARELTQYGAQAGQVVTIDWEQAAEAITLFANDAPWTKAVGEWTASQLIGLGFDAGKINIVGHSHGTYVAFAAANKVIELTKGSQINALVALDPAGNVEALSGFSDANIKFREVSRNSVAIEGSWISGSNVLASTADIAFQVDSASTHTPFTEHSLPITVFSSMLKTERMTQGSYPKALSLSSIMTPFEQQEDTIKLESNRFREFYEGIIEVDTVSAHDAYGDYYVGLPKKITFDPLGTDPAKDVLINSQNPISQ